MADSSATPPGVEASDLYDGPRVVPLASGRATLLAPEAPSSEQGGQQIPQRRPNPPAPIPSDEKERTEYARVIGLALDVLAARLLGLVALVTGCFLWGAVVIFPNEMRIIAASCFSVSLFGPVMWLCYRHGQVR